MTTTIQDLLLYALTAVLGLAASLGTYWAKGVDTRLNVLEKDLAIEKLATGGRLARLEAILEHMSQQLDRIENELRQTRNESK
jgi:hypothetical protein